MLRAHAAVFNDGSHIIRRNYQSDLAVPHAMNIAEFDGYFVPPPPPKYVSPAQMAELLSELARERSEYEKRAVLPDGSWDTRR